MTAARPIRGTTAPVIAGQLRRDARAVHVRTLRVDKVAVDKWGKTMVTCTVIRQQDGDRVTEPMRETTMTVERLASRAFVLLDQTAGGDSE